MSVTVAELSALLGSTAHPAMSDASFDAETTQLAVRARAGDREAFSMLISLHQRAAGRVAAAALANQSEIEEAVQDACVTAWRRIDRLDDPSAFRAWLLRITWRKALDRRRSLTALLRRVRPQRDEETETIDEVASTGNAPDEELLAKERDRVLAQLIRSLPARLRDPFLLAASGEHRYEDIARMLDIPVGSVKWRMAEARRLLREKLERLGLGDKR
jgi:RNA polymerase sigma-70 factor (ECF subfamily)